MSTTAGPSRGNAVSPGPRARSGREAGTISVTGPVDGPVHVQETREVQGDGPADDQGAAGLNIHRTKTVGVVGQGDARAGGYDQGAGQGGGCRCHRRGQGEGGSQGYREGLRDGGGGGVGGRDTGHGHGDVIDHRRVEKRRIAAGGGQAHVDIRPHGDGRGPGRIGGPGDPVGGEGPLEHIPGPRQTDPIGQARYIDVRAVCILG